jgi:hypothetical protein
VGEGSGPTGRRWVAGNNPVVELVGEACGQRAVGTEAGVGYADALTRGHCNRSSAGFDSVSNFK